MAYITSWDINVFLCLETWGPLRCCAKDDEDDEEDSTKSFL